MKWIGLPFIVVLIKENLHKVEGSVWLNNKFGIDISIREMEKA